MPKDLNLKIEERDARIKSLEKELALASETQVRLNEELSKLTEDLAEKEDGEFYVDRIASLQRDLSEAYDVRLKLMRIIHEGERSQAELKTEAADAKLAVARLQKEVALKDGKLELLRDEILQKNQTIETQRE